MTSTTDFDNAEITQQYSRINTRFDVTDEELDNDNSSARLFERSRIKALADEREAVQKKTFTKWVNSILSRVGCRISDLYLDLRDGRMLIKLLEVLSGERLPKPTKGRMRIHCLENVDKALQFLKEQRVHLENMGSHDIVDGNHRLILGLIWTIILRFQIQDIIVETGQEDQKETRSAKDALLLWCQMKTAGYPNVNITNFTTSWKDGMAFNALIHKHRPDLVDYGNLKRSNPTHNLQSAFNVAEQQLGVTKLLDPEDVFTENPDEKSIITYVVAFYHYFSKMKQLAVEGKRVGKVLDHAIETEKMIDKYETLASDLLTWIEQTIIVLNNRKLANSLTGVQQQLQAFNTYRTVEKPPKFQEKGNLEVLLFTIQSRMRANNQRVYTPKEGALVADINRAWERLERAENERERVLRDELIRQEKLEQMARRFDRKAAMRETWLLENQRLVAQDNFGYDLPAVEAAKKKHDAIETDIAAYEERVQVLVDISKELESERYHDAKRIDVRKDNILRLWDYLQELLKARRGRLDKNLTLQRIFQEMLYIISWMDDMKARLLSPDFGKHLLEVEDLLQKHALLENDIALQAERVQNASAAALKFANGDSYKPCDPQVIRERVQHLELCYQELCALAAQRKARLEQSRRFWNFLWEVAELESWIREKEHIFSSLDYGKDLTSVLVLQSKHSAFEDELGARRANLDQVLAEGDTMIRAKHFGSPKVQECMDNTTRQWQQLEELAAFRKQNLQDTQRFFQFQGDADELKAWLLDAKRQMSSDDVGHDEYTTQRQLKKHNDLKNEAIKNGATIDALSKQANALPEELQNTPDIQRRLKDIKDLYMELMSLADLRQKRLDDTMALYTIFSETDACELWMGQKETWLVGLEVPEKLEDLEVVQNRLSILAQDMANVQSRVDDVNKSVKQLEDSRHPRTKEVKECQMRLNKRWDAFKAMVEDKKRKVDSAVSLNNYGLECDETETWIKDKTRVIESTQELGNDLAAVMTIQRKLFGIERDLAAIDSKLTFLRAEADQLAKDHPENANDILARRDELDAAWDTLRKTLTDREDSLGEVSKLQTFLQDMDDFQSWLFKTQKAVASEEMPATLPEAEEQLSLHDAVREDINNHEEDYHRVRDTGAQVTQGQEDDPQYQQLEKTLKGLDRGWVELQKMWDSRKNFLDQGLGFQQFMRDGKAVEAILNNQEYTLAHIDKPDTLAGAEKALKKHEDFVSTMEANEDKIDGAVQGGQRLVDSNNLYSGRVQEKMNSIGDRHNKNKRRAQEVSEKLRDNRDLQHFLQNTQDLTVWINEKMLTAQDTSYDEARNLHSKWLKHQAFMAELASNKDWLNKVDQEGHELMESKPEFEPIVTERLAKLHELWDKLESTTQEKARLLFDANRSELFDQSLTDMKKWLTGLQQQLQTGDEDVKDLTNANILLKKHQMTENQVRDRARELEELQDAVRKHGGGREDQPELEAEQQALQRDFQQLLTPLAQRKGKLEAAKSVHQFYRDLADELLWIEERMPLAMSQEHGHNLQTVQMLLKKNQTLQREIEGHQPRVDEVLERGRRMAAAASAEGRPEAERITEQLRELEEAWARLQDEMAKRRERLNGSSLAQHYYNDADEAEAWIGEQELYMIADEKAKDEQSAMLMLKRHMILKQAVDDYADSIQTLADRAQKLFAEDHPDGEEIIRRQGQVDKQYAGLRELAEDRRKKLDHTFHHFLLSREVEDLEHWIAERDVVASSQEMGQDLDHVTLLRDKFREFARETGMVGQERVDMVNETIDELIEAGHTEAATMAEWKDTINDSWADLLELIDTRAQHLTTSYELFKYFDDGKELVAQIHEKQKELPEDVGEDFSKAESFHRMHAAFERDISALGKQVQQFQETAARLHAQYAGGQADTIQATEREVVEAWKGLLDACDGRRAQLVDTAEKFRFFTMVRDLMAWMESIIQQIETQEKPRDVSSVELLQKYHQGIRSEIEARGAKFTDCIDLGKALLTRKHRDSAEIKEKLVQLIEKRKEMMFKWDDRWDWLRLLLEVCQFARDASVAEAWLIAQEPYVSSKDLGHSVDEVEKLLKRHEAFEKSTATWEERFSALERLTTLELLELRNQQQEMEQFIKEEQRSDKESRREDTGFVEESSQLGTVEEQTLSASGAVEPSSGLLEETAGDSTVPIVSEMRESGSLELEPSVSVVTPKEPERAATMPVETVRAQTVLQEGTLGRKHDVEGSGKKASNRSWNNLYCVLKPGQLSVYKDAKSFGHGVTYHGEDPLSLSNASWEILTNYKKKKHVCKLRLGDGSEYLFQCKDEEELQHWSQAMEKAVQPLATEEASGPSGAKAHSLPPPSSSAALPEPSSAKKDKEKKFSRFAKKK
ncbi:spectrin beta chain, erythrocytic isoform X1 [Epinephelus fuscoguttatus]|uniref:spectrin beta chain, erythrocytic isoform X1 n=1 Tax=Epinephelus fuscoguttatus TaxID=293821 RepID=UPI0020D09D80|nr:spectrin beta chain, erythrocytic isoform X1 [Epinephelus fuscoguttatus]XP_049453118.1 spectrin beta chain, erythrocytic isoform X1 [Epinephelus fuscoguttatus]XP_049453119.1 spectrin beta chain, erythrocytic isoform X1 [Epinephelus fuscoguttatus]